MFNERKINALKEMYPAGTRIQLDHMDDPYHPVASGTMGTVKFVDDAGTIHMSWDSGSSLGLCPDSDEFHIIGKEND